MSSFDKTRKKGFSMSTGKKWTLNIDKRDDVNPGPIYDTQYLKSIDYKCQNTTELLHGTF